ncbi:alpha/beta fold hydrolase [Erythrobacter insulae]|nr:alpha/beta fold hydrolase [Erythrobacter insulae]
MNTAPLITAMALALASTALGSTDAIAAPNEQTIMFETQTGETVEAVEGFLTVPVNRSDPDSGTMKIAYVRFAATTDTPGSPIVYLSGGPGGSGIDTATGPRFPLFMAMRQHADVIAFDQRGTGKSDSPERCVSRINVGEMEVISDAEFDQRHRLAARECAAQWKASGDDLRGFNTAESAQDLSDLRQHLGAEKISLWSISYGSHLALASIAAIPDELDRVIMAATEGLDQTVKLPARTMGYFKRLQEAVNAQPKARALYPDIVGLMQRVNAKLDKEPMKLTIPKRDGGTYDLMLQRRHLQQFGGGLVMDPQYASVLLEMYRQLDEGDTTLTIGIFQRFWTPDQPISFAAMPLAMDRASGITPARMKAFERQADLSPLGKYVNFPMPQMLGEFEEIDLGPNFRDGPFGDVPVLMFTGSLDGRTYPEAHAEATAGLRNVQQIFVENAGHNLFMTTPEVGEAMHQFMRGETAKSDRIVAEAPDFSSPPGL